ncbi:hypothetical protein KEM56_005430 [Ascosphaera pollenicola]|nr:hypothetical protein KEM56_005430 [Ascosphaera pollenicola]
MRLFLIPVARGRTLLYCKKVDNVQAAATSNWHDKLQYKTAQKWAEWAQADKGWKKHTVQWGDKVMQRVPFEEWGLKSVSPLKKSAREEVLKGKAIELLYPKNIIQESRVLSELTLEGSKHLKFLLDKRLVKPQSLTALEHFYAENKAVINGRAVDFKRDKSPSRKFKHQEKGSREDNANMQDEDVLLKHDDGQELAKILEAPELVAEVERAVFQVRQLEGEKDPKDVNKESEKERV